MVYICTVHILLSDPVASRSRWILFVFVTTFHDASVMFFSRRSAVHTAVRGMHRREKFAGTHETSSSNAREPLFLRFISAFPWNQDTTITRALVATVVASTGVQVASNILRLTVGGDGKNQGEEMSKDSSHMRKESEPGDLSNHAHCKELVRAKIVQH